MADKRPVFHPGLAEFFSGFRERRKWTAAAEARAAAKRGFKTLSRQVFLRLATGKTKGPSPEVLRDFAAFYGIDYSVLVATVVEHLYQVKLSEISPARAAELESIAIDLTRRVREAEDQLEKIRAAAQVAPVAEESPPERRAAKSRRAGSR